MIVTALLLLAMQAENVSATPTRAAPDPDKMICRREAVTGSNMSRKVCHTRAQWHQQAAENSGAMERLRGPSGMCRSTSC